MEDHYDDLGDDLSGLPIGVAKEAADVLFVTDNQDKVENDHIMPTLSYGIPFIDSNPKIYVAADVEE